MMNLSSLSSRCAAVIFFAIVLLFSTANAQDLRPSTQERELLPADSKTLGGADSTAFEAMLPPALTIAPLTWGVVGLDSNNVNDGPNLYPVGARVCNTGNAAATNVASAFVWDSVNALINLRTGSSSSLSLASLAAGTCTDFYYEIEITRSAAAYNTKRGFRITATADTLGVISTPTPRELFVEKLVSQNRNSVTQIKLNGVTVLFGGTMNLVVGSTYTIQLIASTATNGYEQIESFINLPNVIFQTLGVSSTYTAPTGYTGDKLYEDACGWDPVPTSLNYRSCIGPANVPGPGGKAGGNVTLTYTVKVLSGSGTSATLNTLIYDFSGSSFHYNSDFSSTFVIAQISLPPSASTVSFGGRVTTADGNGIRNAQIALVEDDGTVRIAKTGSFGYYRFDDILSGQTVVLMIDSKRYTFSQSTRLVTLNDDLTDFDWIAQE